jgi:hypothetical protein
MPMKDLLSLPERAAKPRQEGITHVLDRGLSVAEVDGLAEVAGEYIDMVKLGWGTAVATGNLDRTGSTGWWRGSTSSASSTSRSPTEPSPSSTSASSS